MSPRFAWPAALLGVVAAAAARPADFDALAPPAEIRAAVRTLDPAALAAAAGKVAAAETQLGRPRPGVTAAQLYEVALRVAAERRAKAVAERIAAEPAVKADGRLQTLAAAAVARSAATRTTDPELVVALDQISPEQFALFRGYLTQVGDAKALADKGALERLARHVAGTADLSDAQRKYLGRLVETTVAALPAAPPAAVAAVRAVREEAGPADPEPPAPAPDPAPAPPAPAPAGPAGKLGGDPAALLDDGFEGKIDLAKVGKAWGRGDAAALADAALRMAAEEQLLGRPHNHVPAKLLFKASLDLCVTRDDAATLARLERALKSDRAPDFDGRDDVLLVIGKLGAVKSLVASSRKGRPPLLASVEDTPPESFAAFRFYLDRVRLAAAQRDADLLAALAGGLDTAVELTDDQRAYLAGLAGDPAAAPARPGSPAAVLRALDGESRTAGPATVNSRVAQFCRDHAGQKVDNGECAMLAVRALAAAGGKNNYPPTGLDADYVWGQPVGTARVVNHRPSLSGTGHVVPGDILQFRDVALRQVFPNGGSYSWSYPHHTAVVTRVLGPNSFEVHQQNVGPHGKAEALKKIVQVGTVNLNLLVGGTVWAYRPQPR